MREYYTEAYYARILNSNVIIKPIKISHTATHREYIHHNVPFQLETFSEENLSWGGKKTLKHL